MGVKNLLFAIVFLQATFLLSQNNYTVIDQDTEAPIAFVKVIDNFKSIHYTDIDGVVSLPENVKSVELRFFGYQDTLHRLEDVNKKNQLAMLTDAQSYEEVVILPGENPAHRIIRNAIDNRKENHPLKKVGFTCNFYNKFLVTNSDNFNFDTTLAETKSDKSMIKYFTHRHLFISEAVGVKTFYPPAYEKDVITSYKTSGLKNPLFASIGNQMQSFSFYDNQFKILETDYINPIAEGSLRRYLFILEDTTVVGQDSTFVIKFQPKKGKNFEGLKGLLYINSNNWAIQRVIAEPNEEKQLSLKVIQEYTLVNNEKWFPSKLSAEFTSASVTLGDSATIVFKNNMYVSNVAFDRTKRKGFNPVQLEVEEAAAERTVTLDTARMVELNSRDTSTYHFIDSLSKADNIEYKLELLSALTQGKFPLGSINLPLERILDFNLYEGYRLGLGLETSKKLSKQFVLGGYFAYGFRDKAWKWGGYSTIDLLKKREIKLDLAYQEDVVLRAVDAYHNKGFDLNPNEIYRDFYMVQMERQRLGEIVLSGLITPNLKLSFFGNYQRRWFEDQYEFLPANPSVFATQDKFDQAIVGAEINWNIREKIMQLGDRRVSLGTKYPRIKLKFEQGVSSIFESKYDFSRINFQLQQDVSIRGWGKLSILSNSGVTLGETPLSFIQQPVGTGGNWNLTVKNTFETMLPSEFFATRKTDFFFRFTFLKIKTKFDWTSPQFGIHHAMGVGEIDNATTHKNLIINDYKEGYTESGLIIDHILNSGFSGLGLGVFYRYGNYTFAETVDNFTFKLSFSVNL